jgi:large subunit ribosomal protein L25
MKHPKLTVTKREIFGKKVKKLRRDGILPANIYGKDLESTAVQADMKEFMAVFDQVGETGLIDLELDGKMRPVLVKNPQLAYPLRTFLHVDFFQVNLKEKVKTMVPVVLTGEAQATTDETGLLLQTLNEVEIEALPDKLPENIEVDVTGLAQVDDQILVSDLTAPEGVEILTDPGQVVAKIGELVVEEPEPEEPAEGEEGAEGEAAEGEAGAEGEEKSDSEGENAQEDKNDEKPQSE